MIGKIWLASVLLGATAFGQETVSVHVIDDSGDDVAAVLSVIGGNQVDTDGSGRAQIVIAAGKKLNVTSKGEGFYPRTVTARGSSMTVTLLKKSIAANLEANATALETAGEHAKAAFVWNELYSQMLTIDGDRAETLRLKVLDALARHFDVADATWFDPLQDRRVMSVSLRNSVRAAQAEHGLKTTGVAGYPLLSKLAGGQISKYMFTRI